MTSINGRALRKKCNEDEARDASECTVRPYFMILHDTS